MKTKNIIAAGLAGLLTLSACAQPGEPGPKKQDVGTILGAIGGAVAGAQVGKGKGQLVGVAAGTLLGAALGNQIGESLDKMDMMYYNQTSQNALERSKTGQASTWTNPDSGNSGSITPTRTFKTADGQNCREYQQTITIGGKTQQGYGTACRQSDGSWKIVE